MVNKVILIGRLGKDPEIRHLDNGVVVANFTLATNENFTDKAGNKIERTEWHRIVVWRKLAEIAEQYLKKGKLIYVEGKLQTRSWDDKDGNKQYTTEIVADNFQMLGSPSEVTGHGPGSQREEPANEEKEEKALSESEDLSSSESDDLPF